MVLHDICMLAALNRRSRAYLEGMLEKQYKPSYVLLLTRADGQSTPDQSERDDLEEFRSFLRTSDIPFEVFNTLNVNSKQVRDALGLRQENHVIYSGPAGAILRKKILALGKKFLHVHPGKLPEFRGSTTIYYQMLLRNTCGVTALLLQQKIDAGPIVAYQEFPLPKKGEDVDFDYDTSVRTTMLNDALRDYISNKRFSTQPQSRDNAETYYVMHPILRHLARLKMRG